MPRIKIDLTGKDAIFLSNSHRYCNGLAGLEMYRNPPEKIPSLGQLKEAIDRFQQRYEAALNGDRVQISMREKARKEVTNIFKMIQYYLQSVANDDDVPALLQAGFHIMGPVSRKKSIVAPTAG